MRLSVVIPALNVERHLDDLLRSLRANVHDGFEFIVVDDGSTDRTPEILGEWAARIPGLRVLRNGETAGPSAARNRGLAEAAGQYITYLDADDWVLPGYFADLVTAIETLGCDFVRVDHVEVHGARRVPESAPMGRRDVVLNPRDAILPVHENSMVDYPDVWAGVYRRGLADAGLLTLEERLHTAEDRPWIWRLHREAASYAVVSLAGLHYRRGLADSLTAIGDERQLHFFDAYDLVLEGLANDPDRDRFMRKAVRSYCATIAGHVKRCDRLTPELQEKLRTRGAATLRALPADALAETLPGLGAARIELCTRFLGFDVGGLMGAA